MYFSALLIFAVIAEKTVNERQFLPMGEGGSYFLHIGDDTLEITLTDFIITRDLSNAVDYESRLLINKKDTFSVRVNHPYSYEHVRFYQSSYRSLTPFYFCMEDTLKLFEGQTDTLQSVPLTFLEYDPVLERAAIRYNKVLFYLPVEKEYQFMNRELYIYPGPSEIGTVLEYVEVRGHTILIIIVLTMVLLLFYRTIKRK
ncbi:MAG: cytochrome c biogenesis protein ResB [Candidatus Marinimicrobia bacterium]|nr:cytochrome c biogenesis protein ResB [Candidatus Neomarinimicrobiota bacterium]